MAFKVGTANSDNLFGTFSSDSIYGYGSGDRIFGRGGDDTIYGDRGPKEVPIGQPGDDYINGGAGSDRIFGDGGNDTILGGLGNDNLYGNLGYDELLGGAGNDFLVGGQRGNHVEIDTLTGGSGSDKFVLGDYHGNFYSVAGNSDYALIKDFQTGQDTVQLDLGNYSLGVSPIAGISGAAIYEGGELLGILEGVNRFGLQFEDNAFTTTLKGFDLGIAP